MSSWFYLKGEERIGPVSSDDLRHLVASRVIERTDMVWKEGMADWVAASAVKGLFPPPLRQPAIEPPPPPPPQPPSQPASLPPFKKSTLTWGLRVAALLLMITPFLPWWHYSAEAHAHTDYGALRSQFGSSNIPEDVNLSDRVDVLFSLFDSSAPLASFILIVGIALISLTFLESRVPYVGIMVPAASLLLFVFVVCAMLFATPSKSGMNYESSNAFASAGAEYSFVLTWGAWLGLVFALAVFGQAVGANLKTLMRSKLRQKTQMAVEV